MEAIAPLLAGLPCAAIHASVKDGSIELSGYALQSDITRIKSELRALEGVEQLNAEILPSDKINCKIIELISPYWLTNKQSNIGTSIRTRESNANFQAGDYLVLDIKSPSYDSHLYIDYRCKKRRKYMVGVNWADAISRQHHRSDLSHLEMIRPDPHPYNLKRIAILQQRL